MTVDEALLFGETLLTEAGRDNALFDAKELLCKAAELDKYALLTKRGEDLPEDREYRYREFLDRRAGGYPLQYLLGEWDFYDLTLQVGEGVLIPRPETEILVEEALKFLRTRERPDGRPAEVLDLCAGSGCIGLAVAKHAPDCRVTLVEQSPEALRWLNRNRERLNLPNVRVLQGDVLAGPAALDLPAADLILSNPPYVTDAEMAVLQEEVRYEPRMALEAGEDGLRFYRSLAEDWLPILLPGGMMAVECGDRQADEVDRLFAAVTPYTAVIPDFNGIGRVVRAAVFKD